MYHHLLTRGVITLCLVGLLVLSGLAQAGARQDDPAPRYAVTDLGAIKDYPGTVAFALNEKGVVVGQGYDPVTYLGRAAVYKDGKLRALIKGETGSSIAQDVNAAGQIVGYSTTAPDQAWYETGTHAVLWDGEDIVDLGTLAGGEISVAAAINVGGEIVGRSTVASGESHAFLWQDGELLDLNDLVQGGDVVLKYAYDINDKGLIVAMGYTPNGFEHAFLLTPIAD